MKCDQCENEATVHEVTVKNGAKVEKHLCESCAKQQGIAIQPSVPINELITKYVMAHGSGAVIGPQGQVARASICPSCSITYADFRQTGLLGCPECYRAFEAQLGPLLERAHEGAVNHSGKIPRRALAASRLGRGGTGQGPGPRGLEAMLGTAQERAKRLAALRKQLDDAVESEQYERAATLRDELRKLSEMAAEVAGGIVIPTAPPKKGGRRKSAEAPDDEGRTS